MSRLFLKPLQMQMQDLKVKMCGDMAYNIPTVSKKWGGHVPCAPI